MQNDPFVQRRKLEYFKAMTEAKTEYLIWERQQDFFEAAPNELIFVCPCGNPSNRKGKCESCRAKERAEKHAPCSCGEPYFAKGFCRKCYYRMYNKIRLRRSSMLSGR